MGGKQSTLLTHTDVEEIHQETGFSGKQITRLYHRFDFDFVLCLFVFFSGEGGSPITKTQAVVHANV